MGNLKDQNKGEVQQAIFTLTDNIPNALNQQKQVGGIFCDL
jgi:hypothetical protein